MLGIGFGEILIIVVIALIFLGPERIPELFHAVGRVYNEFKRAGLEFRAVISEEIEKEKTDKGKP